MSRSNDSGLFRAEFEYLYDTDNEEPETDKSPEYEAQELSLIHIFGNKKEVTAQLPT